MEEEISKTCKMCKRELPLSKFFNASRGLMGKASNCKQCEKERLYAWRRKKRASKESTPVDSHGSDGSGLSKPLMSES